MPAYGVAQAGWNGPPNQGLNVSCLEEGQQITLVSAADAVAAAFKSIAFARGLAQSGNRTITFEGSGMANSSVWQIEAADQNLDASFQVIAGPFTGNNVPYSDIGASAFYRAHITTFEAGDVPVITATRT